VKTFNLPMLVLGGGGYSIRNVARCWCYETSKLLDTPISDQVPWHEYMDYYLPDYKLHIPVSNMKNENTKEQLEKKLKAIFDTLSQVEHAPNVQMHRAADAAFNPTANSDDDDETDDTWGPDVRLGRHRRRHLAEYFDEDEVEADRPHASAEYDDVPAEQLVNGHRD